MGYKRKKRPAKILNARKRNSLRKLSEREKMAIEKEIKDRVQRSNNG